MPSATSILNPPVAGSLAELAQLLGTAFSRMGAAVGITAQDFLAGIAAMYSARDWRGGVEADEDEL